MGSLEKEKNKRPAPSHLAEEVQMVEEDPEVESNTGGEGTARAKLPLHSDRSAPKEPLTEAEQEAEAEELQDERNYYDEVQR